ncbi:Retrovirus-related Pol polyprotein from transposon RE1 [Vitis vinifera]|uniref:Retrovirus-related Pol polyprotein from transposon RE1 n=1 Tax=Vitis vinifera TaxID=29760 RepID=A0A438EI60_VITVI|nr:Retrovirus-related Pol polyprotein from transposon RE1 [Vitis vinifera]
MVVPSSSPQTENCSKHGAPFFTGTDYSYWKARMTWFTEIVNGLEALGRVINESEKVMKILRSLPSKWHTKSEDKKKKNIALKATTKEEEDVEEEKPSEEDDDLALITRKLNKYMRGERFRGKKFTSRRNPSRRESSSHGDKEKWEEKGDLICFKCKKLRHIKYDCPLYKIEARRRMKKAMMATWSESEESSEEEKEKEVANMCFMAIDDLDEGSKEDKWFLDSGCSRHMTGDESKFAFLTKRKGGYVTFGDNAKGRIIGQGFTVTCIRSDHGREFENFDFEEYCNKHGINHNFSAPRTPQQNGVIERKNKTLQEMARTMLNENNLPKYFWAEAVNTSCYVLNRILLRPILKKTPYELWKNKKPNISYFKVFGCKSFILNTKDNLGKFDAKSDVGIFLGYSTSSKAFRVFNKRTMVIEESIHVIFDESNNSLQERESFDDDLGLETSMEKLQIEDKRQQEESEEDPRKKNHLWHYLLLNKCKVNKAKTFQKIGSLLSTIHKIKSLVIHQVGEVEMSMMGELNFFLGLQIQQLKKGTFINQAKYIKDLLKRFNMEEAKVMKTPMSSSIKLDMDEKSKSIDSTMYRSIIGCLLYLTASRPDIMYSVCLCARFQSCPKESHLSAVKRILRYLKGTMNIGLWYPKADNFKLIGFSDAVLSGCKVERKSTSGTCHFLGHSLVSWHSKKQNSRLKSHQESQHEEMMAYLRSVFPPPPPQP